MEELSVTEARAQFTQLEAKLERMPDERVIAVHSRRWPALAVLRWADYQSLTETLTILSDKDRRDAILEGKAQVEDRDVVPWNSVRGELIRRRPYPDGLEDTLPPNSNIYLSKQAEKYVLQLEPEASNYLPGMAQYVQSSIMLTHALAGYYSFTTRYDSWRRLPRYTFIYRQGERAEQYTVVAITRRSSY